METPDGHRSQFVDTPPSAPGATRGFYVSLIGLLVFAPLAVVGLIMSIRAYRRGRRIGAPVDMAIAGIVCGALGCLACLAWVPVVLFVLVGYSGLLP